MDDSCARRLRAPGGRGRTSGTGLLDMVALEPAHAGALTGAGGADSMARYTPREGTSPHVHGDCSGDSRLAGS